MSFSARLKEQRERMGLTQIQLATALGITKGAVGNYETGASSPKAEILYKLFDILCCDANFLFQDEMAALHEANATPQEMEHLVKKYRALDPYGKDTVDAVLENELKRCQEQARPQKKMHLYRMIARDGTCEERWMTDEEVDALEAENSTLERATGI